MSVVLSVYGQQAFKEYLLPAVNNTETSIVLSKDVFRLPQDIEIHLEVIEHQWSILQSNDFQLKLDKELYQGERLKDGDIIRLELNHVNTVSIIVRMTNVYFSVFEKYSFAANGQPVSIGKDAGNEVSYDNPLLSGKHCELIRDPKGGITINDLSRNGVFVNNRKVNRTQRLSFGDRIDVFGLCIVVLNQEIAINTAENNVIISERVLKGCVLKGETVADQTDRTKKILYHRSPRFLPQIDDEKVEIDAAPNPRELQRQSLLMTLGPSMTMALPMIMGSVISMIAANKSGASASVFMYTGMIIAIGSAALGTFWGFINMRNAKKRTEEEEAKRIHLYSEYLRKKEHEINEKNRHNAEVLYQRYASAEECSRYNASHTQLWNRNRKQEDFLMHRLGIGVIKSPTEIIVPKERFTMIPDELMDKPKAIHDHHKTLKNVPVCIDLLKNRLVGVAGGRAKTGAVTVMKDLIVQIAANNSYTDVKIAIIYDAKDSESRQAWSFARWLPHVWNETKTFRYVAENREDASDVFYELSKVIRQRAEDNQNNEEVPKPFYVVFVANPEMLEEEMISNLLLNPAPVLGVTTVLMSESYQHLPNEVELIIENDGEYSGVFHVSDSLEDRIPVKFDDIPPGQLETFARTLANIEITEMETGGDIPGSLTFFDMYGVKKLSELSVVERWRKNRTYESMRAMVGFKAGGVPCYLDIHEKYHGPHGLVAGTTGSGKSETLQTYILSLAINYSPNDIGFFVIDYKGGGMANLFSNLPHLIGQISNLSGNQVRRAMVSIKSENVRRQRIFNEYGVNNINSYTKLVKNNEAKLPVPHMFIIIDEFAELKREEPDFMRELISVAQVGRSLGVHLILATQKPSGTVDDNIWSNSKFRLCLRVQDKQDSNDMLHRPDAAYITQAGRCYLQVGNDELFELFQSGWSGATYSEDDEDMRSDVAKMISMTGKAALEGNRTKYRKKEEEKVKWIALLLEVAKSSMQKTGFSASEVMDGAESATAFYNTFFTDIASRNIEFPMSDYNINRVIDMMRCAEAVEAGGTTDVDSLARSTIAVAGKIKKKLPEAKEKTQLDAVVDYLKTTAESNGYDYNLQLWLPVLPEKLLLSTLAQTEMYDGNKWPSHGGAFSLETTIGMFDDPENQNQSAFSLNISDGNAAICGSVATGKSVFLQTMVYGLINRYSPDELNLYLIDFSANMLSAFASAPHVGGVITEEDNDKIDKFFVMLNGIIEKRKTLFKGGNYAQYVRSKGRAEEPAIVVVFDNYGSFRTKTANVYDDLIVQISKEGNAQGIYMIFSAGGFQTAEIPMKLSDTLKTTFSLEMTDRFQLMEVMRVTHLDIAPEEGVAGRGIAKIGERILEFQTALSLDSNDDFGRGEEISKMCQNMQNVWTGKRAVRIPEIPEKPVYEEFIKLDEAQTLMRDDRHIPIGYDAKFASVYGVDLSKIYTYLLTGKAKTGKSNLLKSLILDASEKGGRVVIFDFDEEYTRIAKQANATYITSAQEMSGFFGGLVETLKERKTFKQGLREQDVDDEETYRRMQEKEKIFLFIGRLPSFVETAYKQQENVANASGLIENILDKGDSLNIYWFSTYEHEEAGRVVGYDAFNLFTRRKTGLHFGGNVSTQNIFTFDFLNYTEQNKTLKPNIALVPSGDEDSSTTHVVIPQLKG